MPADAAYLRFPTIRGDRLAFVAEDDVWVAPAAGGRAWRLTADAAPVSGTRLSPDGRRVAYASRRDGRAEVHVADVDGGGGRRLTYWGAQLTGVLGWLDDDRVLATSTVGRPSPRETWAWAVPVDGSPPRQLPLGPVAGYAAGPGGAVAVGTDGSSRGAASWKRYRGGTMGKLWLDATGSGQFERFLAGLDGQLEDPTWVGARLAFLSDHEGWGNVYSVAADGSDLRRHTDHTDGYARALDGDGARLVYQFRGDLLTVDDLSPGGQPSRLDVVLGGPRTGRQPRPERAAEAIGDLAPDHTGRASAVEVRGTVHWLTHRDGPVRAVAAAPGTRIRLPVVVPTAAPDPGGVPDHEHPLVVRVTDADGDDALEIGPADGSAPARRLAAGRLGRVLELATSPDGRLAAVATHDGRLLVVDLADGHQDDGEVAAGEASSGDQGSDARQRVRPVVEGAATDVSGVTFSPDSRWLAWSHPGEAQRTGRLRQIRLAELLPDHSRVVDATPLRFVDTEPVFTRDGRYLAFLSVRTFDPVYDAHAFDLAFLSAQRPYLVPLGATTPSPFDPEPGGRPAADPGRDRSSGDRSEGDRSNGADEARPPEVAVDTDGLAARAVPVPVAAGRYHGLRAGTDALLWLDLPITGELGDAVTPDDDDPPAADLIRLDLRTRDTETLAAEVRAARVTGDGARVVIVGDDGGVRVRPVDRRVDRDDKDAVDVDLSRLRVVVDPPAMWRQMYEEQGRLMRDHFWVADMGGVDWDEALARYRPLVDRVATRDDLSEVLWEVVGELGSSHAYETPPARSVDRGLRVGHLGADLARDGDGSWRVARVLPGEPSSPAARSPLLAPGAGVREGDALVAVDGRPVTREAGPGPLLVGAAGRPVELTVRPAGGGEDRRVVVVPLADDTALRYHDWVAGRRAATHATSGGRVGYLHVPDMMAGGWAQLHRDLHTEVARDALVVDLRDNRGGHLSELVLEKLARRVRARSVSRHAPEEQWPTDAPRGPMVAVTNQWAGSDGDIGTAMFRSLGLGPVVGTRTWGGVIGIDSRYTLVDGTSVTQPRYGFWTTTEGWGIENYGVDPDVEVPVPPQAWGAGEDPQLDTAVRLVLEALRTHTPVPAPDPATRPDRSAPALPPRP